MATFSVKDCKFIAPVADYSLQDTGTLAGP